MVPVLAAKGWSYWISLVLVGAFAVDHDHRSPLQHGCWLEQPAMQANAIHAARKCN